MAGRSVSKAVKQHAGNDMPSTKEKQALWNNYSQLSRWDRTFLFLIVQSMATGRLTPEADKLSWSELLQTSDLPNSAKAVLHG